MTPKSTRWEKQDRGLGLRAILSDDTVRQGEDVGPPKPTVGPPENGKSRTRSPYNTWVFMGYNYNPQDY